MRVMPKDACPTCGAPKDVRAKRCRPCNFRDNHPRAGRGRRRFIGKRGYVMLNVGKSPALYEHRVVMEQIIGRKLTMHEHVHHKNGDRTDNRPENLELLPVADHHRQHMTSERAKWMSVKGHAARWGKDATPL